MFLVFFFFGNRRFNSVVLVYINFKHKCYCCPFRISDVLGLPIQTLILKAGDNKSIPCPGVNEHFLVSSLSWLSVTHQVKMVEFTSETTTVWANQHRISLLPETYGLSFHPAAGEDSGDYICLVNSRPKPDALVRLIVQGEYETMPVFHLYIWRRKSRVREILISNEPEKPHCRFLNTLFAISELMRIRFNYYTRSCESAE